MGRGGLAAINMKFKKLVVLAFFLPAVAFAQPLLRNTFTLNNPGLFPALLPVNTSAMFFVGDIALDGTIYASTKASFTDKYFFFDNLTVTNGFTNLTLTASTLVKADANQGEASIANGSGVLTNDGAGALGWNQNFNVITLNAGTLVVTNPPNINLQSATNLLGQNVVWNTNASDSVLMPVGKYTLLVTNNNVQLAANFLSGPLFSATNVNWSGVWITNNTATAKTLGVPSTCICPGTAPGTANTFFITNVGVFSAAAYGNSLTVGVFKSFP
jgi:hypothetical protein